MQRKPRFVVRTAEDWWNADEDDPAFWSTSECWCCGGQLHAVTPAQAMTVVALTDSQLRQLAQLGEQLGWDVVASCCDGCDRVVYGPRDDRW